MIKIQIIGYLGKDSVVNNVNGKNVVNFSVAHSEKYKDAAGTEINKTTWVNCAYWCDSTKIAQYLKSGTLVYAEGLPEAHPFKGNDGSAKADLRCRVFNIQLLGGKKEGNSSSDPTPVTTTSNNDSWDASHSAEDDLPF